MSIELLARVPLFTGMSPERLRVVHARSPVRRLADGEVVARCGEPADALLVVEAGALAATHDAATGHRVRFGTFAAPCAVDKVALLDGGPHTATWHAVGPTQVRLVNRASVVELIDEVGAARHHVLAHLAAEVRRRRAGAVLSATADASSRLADWLLDETAVHGPVVPLPHGQQGLGEAIGASRVTVNRCLRRLHDEGIISLEQRGSVRVLAPELMAARAQRSRPHP